MSIVQLPAATSASLRARVASSVRAHFAFANVKPAAAARAIGMSQAAMSRRTTGDTAFDVDDLEKIAEFLGVDVAAFFAGAQNPQPGGPVGGSGLPVVGPAGIEPTTSTV